MSDIRARLEAWHLKIASGEAQPEPLFDIAEDACDLNVELVGRIAELEADRNKLYDEVEAEREKWRDVVIKIQTKAHMMRIWGGMEWRYSNLHAKKINDLCESALEDE